MRSICTGKKNHKHIRVRTNILNGLEKKLIPDKRSKRKIRRTLLPLTLNMREKLKKREGRKIYDLRFPIAEGTIGLIKEVRGGNKFWRRSLERVQTEWTERCIAHNLGKMLEFARA